MASLTIRNLDDGVKARLRVRAAERGRSMEEEARSILAAAVERSPADEGLGTRLRRRFADLEGGELRIPPRSVEGRALPDFSGPDYDQE